MTNPNRVTINADNISYTNLAKGFAFNLVDVDPSTLTTDGYPKSTPASGIGANPTMPTRYYGTFTWSWSGQASMQILGPPIVVSSGGASIVELGTASGDLPPGNITILSATAPSVVFAFGWNIQSISNGSGLIRINTKTNYVGSGVGFTAINNKVMISGANINTGANGEWTITNLTASSFDLVGSTFTNAQASALGQAIFAEGNLTISLHNVGTYSSFSNLVWCRTADVAAVAAGQIIDSGYISELQYLFNNATASKADYGWLRFMDAVGVQTNFECDFAQRIPGSYISYSVPNVRPGYYTTSASGAITNTGDAYTCGDPSVSVWSGSAYLDNAIVQGIPSATNAGVTPTLNVGGHGAKPIFNNYNSAPFFINIATGATTPGTDVLHFSFSAASWVSPQLNGGATYNFSYPTVAGDGNVTTLRGNLATALANDPTLAAAKIFFGNSFIGLLAVPRSAQQQRLTLTYTSGTASITVGNLQQTSLITAGSVGTFIYNYILDGWIYQPGGMTCSIPLEAMVDMCNRAGAHCWYNFGTTRAAYITAVTQFFGDGVTGLTSGLKLGFEAWNEVWNLGAQPWPFVSTLGQSLGWSASGGEANLSYVGLRTLQYAAIAKPAWTGKGRNASDFYVLQMHQLGEVTNGNFDNSSLKGTSLVTSNNTYASYGALNGTGTATANYNSSPNRPVDITTAIGQAPYWNSHYLAYGSFTDATQVTGTSAQNLSTLVAAHNFATSNVSAAFSALVDQFDHVGTIGPLVGLGADFLELKANYSSDEAICAPYDAGRSTPLAVLHYEAGPSFGIGSNGNNGVNSITFNSVLTADITALKNQIVSLGWNVSTWTVSTTNDPTEMATMILQMLQAWKFDVDNNGNAFNSGSYKNQIKTSYYQALKTISGSHRETKPAQYSVAGSNWGFWPSSIYDPSPYQARIAISEWNADSLLAPKLHRIKIHLH